MNDLISRQAAIDLLKQMRKDGDMVPWEGKDVFARIRKLPSAQPERKRGKWEMLQMPISPPVYKCSVCGSHALQSMTGCLMNRHYEANLTNYCPNCGADMRGEQDE